MALITESDLLEYMPDLLEYGIQDFSDEIAKTDEDIYRLLRIRWWPSVVTKIYDISVARTGYRTEMDTTKLKPSELKRSAVFYCLSYHIIPKLSKFEVDGDRFREMMVYYKTRFDEEFDLAMRELHYDWDSDGLYENEEIVHKEQLRLVR